MRNYKKTTWIKEIPNQPGEKFSKGFFYFGCALLLSETPLLKKEKF